MLFTSSFPLPFVVSCLVKFFLSIALWEYLPYVRYYSIARNTALCSLETCEEDGQKTHWPNECVGHAHSNKGTWEGDGCNLVCVRNVSELFTVQWGRNPMVRRNTLLPPSALFPWSQRTDLSQPGCLQSSPSTQRLTSWCTIPLFSPSGIDQTCWDSRSLMYPFFLTAF